MMIRSKIKWFALGGLVLSFLSLLVHMFLAKTSVELVQYSVMTQFIEDLDIGVVGKQVKPANTCIHTVNENYVICTLMIFFWLLQGVRSKKLWKKVLPLEALQPYANPRTKYPSNIYTLHLVL